MPQKTKLAIISATCALSFGFCSYEKQLELCKKRYGNNLDSRRLKSMIRYQTNPPQHTNPVELQGVRIAETINDLEAIAILNRLFGSHVDGYIAPRLYSPFHTEKTGKTMHSELVLFNPLKSGIKHIREVEVHRFSTYQLPLTGLLYYNRKIANIFSVCEDLASIWTGGDKSSRELREAIERAHIYNPGRFIEENEEQWQEIETRVQKLLQHFPYGNNNMCDIGDTRMTTIQVKPWKLSSI